MQKHTIRQRMLDFCICAAPGISQWQATEHGPRNALALQQLFILGAHNELPYFASPADFYFFFRSISIKLKKSGYVLTPM